MIAALHGEIIDRSDGIVTVMTASGVGYEVRIGDGRALAASGITTLSIWHIFNESSHQDVLFGFLTIEELELAKLVAETDGVGPGKAHKLVAMAGVPMVVRAVQSGDISELNESVKGLGPKTLRAILGTLKGNVGLGSQFGDPRISTVRLALSGLGIAAVQINSAIDRILSENPKASPEQIVKLLLDSAR